MVLSLVFCKVILMAQMTAIEMVLHSLLELMISLVLLMAPYLALSLVFCKETQMAQMMAFVME